MSRETNIKIYSFVFGALATNTMLGLFHVVNEVLLNNNASLYCTTAESTAALLVGVGMFRNVSKFMREEIAEEEYIQMQEIPGV